MASRQITHHAKSSRYVQTSLTEHEGRIVEAFADDFADPAERADAERAMTTVIRLVHRRMQRATDEAVQADDDYARELGDDAQLLAVRDELLHNLRQRVITVRAQLVHTFGATAFRQTGVKDGTPADPVGFHRFASTFVDSLAQLQLPAAQVDGFTFDGRAAAASLCPDVKKLGEAIEAVNRDARENQAAKVDRDRKWERSQRIFSIGANFASAVLDLAGFRELSRRVRPTGRRQGTVAEPPEEAVADAPLPAAPDEDAA